MGREFFWKLQWMLCMNQIDIFLKNVCDSSSRELLAASIYKKILRIKRSKRCSSLISLLYLNPESLLYSTKRYKVGARELVNEGVINLVISLHLQAAGAELLNTNLCVNHGRFSR